MDWRTYAAVGALGLAAFAAPARADETSDLRQQLESLQRKVAQMENFAPSQDEISASVARYMATAPATALVGGGADGSAGFPLGKKPYIKEGPNKLEIGLRMQVRYSAFLYGDDAVGVVGNGATPEAFTITDAAPRDRSGFELERLYLVFEGTFLCEDISYKVELNFDTDSGTGLEKNYAYVDWKYTGEHHVRAGSDKVAYCYEENNSSSALAFVDRSILTKAFEVGFQTGVAAWGYFGDCDCPKRFMYKFQAGNGEGRQNQEGGASAGSPYNRDARDTFSDNLLFAGMFEWNITCDKGDYKWDEVDHRACDKRCEFNAAVGVAGYYEDDDDVQRSAWGGLALRGSSSARAERYGLDAWFRAQYMGWSLLAEYMLRSVDWTAGSTTPTQEDSGVALLVHHRFAESNWGVGVRGALIWIDDDFQTFTVAGNPPVKFEDTITEVGLVVNYYFWDHNNKLSADVNYVMDNSGVNSSSAGYMNGNSRGVVVEDGVMLRIQWQINF